MTQELFNSITRWQEETFPNSTALSKVHHLTEEIYELTNDIVLKKETVRLEFADCFILLMGAANRVGLSYEDLVNAIQEKHEINLKRKWGNPDINGVVRHEK